MNGFVQQKEKKDEYDKNKKVEQKTIYFYILLFWFVFHFISPQGVLFRSLLTIINSYCELCGIIIAH